MIGVVHLHNDTEEAADLEHTDSFPTLAGFDDILPHLVHRFLRISYACFQWLAAKPRRDPVFICSIAIEEGNYAL
jgi:hypothetical protein